MSRVTLHGWGRTTPGISTVRHVSSEAEITATFESSGALIARGLGRSYGDAAQVSGGTVLVSENTDVGPVDDGGISLGLKRFKRSLLQTVDLHKQARAIVADAFKEEIP